MSFLFGSCPRCHQLLPESASLSGEMTSCPHCDSSSTLLAFFPALRTPLQKSGRTPAASITGESSCLYHTGNKASAICSSCGAFICPLCEIHLQAEPICPACLERQARSGQNKLLKKNHYLWDNISFALALYVPATFVFWFLSFFSAPCALFLALRHWRHPGVLHRPSRARLVLAILLSLLQITAWFLLFLYLFNEFTKLPGSRTS